MPSFPLNNVTTSDQYTNQTTLGPLPGASRVNVDVFNAAIYWQAKYDGAPNWDNEVFMAPGSRSLSRPGVVGFRVRSAVQGAPAQVTVEAVVA